MTKWRVVTEIWYKEGQSGFTSINVIGTALFWLLFGYFSYAAGEKQEELWTVAVR